MKKAATITIKPDESVQFTNSEGTVVAVVKLLYTEGKRGTLHFQSGSGLKISRVTGVERKAA